MHEGVTGLVTGVERSRDQPGDIIKREALARQALLKYGGKSLAGASDIAPSSSKGLIDAINQLSKRVLPSSNRMVVEDRTGGNATITAGQIGFQ